jgi:hypothetical protein
MLSLASGCYTFKGISIDPNVNTFFVQNFENVAGNAPPTLGLDFGELLKQKIRTETRLRLLLDDPDITITGKVTEFRVQPVAPQPGELVAKNQLHVTLRIGYINNRDEKKGWPNEQDKRFFAEFDSDQDLLAIQDRLLTQVIYPQLLEDVFNAIFNDW